MNMGKADNLLNIAKSILNNNKAITNVFSDCPTDKVLSDYLIKSTGGLPSNLTDKVIMEAKVLSNTLRNSNGKSQTIASGILKTHLNKGTLHQAIPEVNSILEEGRKIKDKLSDPEFVAHMKKTKNSNDNYRKLDWGEFLKMINNDLNTGAADAK